MEKLTFKQYLGEIYKPDNYYTKVYRSFGVPLRKIWSSTTNDFHNPSFTSSHKGTWVATDKNFAAMYGTSMGGGYTLQLPVLGTYLVSSRLLERLPDTPQEGNAYKLKPSDLKRLVEVEMYVNGQWVPFNKSVLYKSLKTSKGLDSLLSIQEIEKVDCPTPMCSTHNQSISSIEDIDELCPLCIKDFGLDKILAHR